VKSTRPSDTAKLIARSILLASLERDLQLLVAEGEAEAVRRILSAADPPDRLLPFIHHALVRRLLLGAERLLLPGIISHYLARKRQIGSAVENAIAAGCTRLVVIGAGYDCLAWLLHRRHSRVEFVELDHPATQELKRKALGGAGNLSHRPIDLTSENPSTAIAGSGGATVFVIEGLTMYLPADRVAAILKDVAALAGTGGKVIFTFMERGENGSMGFYGESRLIARWLRARNEPFLWGIAREKMPAFLKDSGLRVDELYDHDDLRRNQLVPRGIAHLRLARGELICVASPISS